MIDIRNKLRLTQEEENLLIELTLLKDKNNKVYSYIRDIEKIIDGVLIISGCNNFDGTSFKLNNDEIDDILLYTMQYCEQRLSIKTQRKLKLEKLK